MSIRTTLIASFVLATLAAPFAAAAEPVVQCAPPDVADACVVLDDNDRVSYHGGWVYDHKTGTFVAAGRSEGSGFFGYFEAYDAFVYSPVTGQYVVVVLAFNDGHPSDGEYEYGGLVVATWNDAGIPAAEAYGGYSDSDGDGEPDAEGAFYGGGVALP